MVWVANAVLRAGYTSTGGNNHRCILVKLPSTVWIFLAVQPLCLFFSFFLFLCYRRAGVLCPRACISLAPFHCSSCVISGCTISVFKIFHLLWLAFPLPYPTLLCPLLGPLTRSAVFPALRVGVIVRYQETEKKRIATVVPLLLLP